MSTGNQNNHQGLHQDRIELNALGTMDGWVVSLPRMDKEHERLSVVPGISDEDPLSLVAGFATVLPRREAFLL